MLFLDNATSNSQIVFIASDHGGYEGKKIVIEECKILGINYEDLGTHSDASVDYPEFGVAAGQKVGDNPGSCGIVLCGTGIGISISANKVSGVRAALCTSVYHVEMARKHNDANILAMGGRVSSPSEIKEMVQAWFVTSFEGGRHSERVDKIHSLTGC